MKYKISKRLMTVGLLVFNIVLMSSAQSASILSGNINVDNKHTTYISTNNSVTGNQVASGSRWQDTDSFSGVSLLQGQDYFLHINARDTGGIAGFIGDFSLAGIDHVFANGDTSITTNSIDWLVSSSGWSGYLAATISEGINGVKPWKNRAGVDSNATWIWSSDNQNDNNVFFSLAITSTSSNSVSVPVPADIWLFSIGLIGFLSVRKKTKWSELLT